MRFSGPIQHWLMAVSALVVGNGAIHAADFTSPTLGSYLVNARDLELENILILGETVLPDGPVLLEVSAYLRNLDTGLWSNTGINVLTAMDAGSVDYLPSSMVFGDAATAGSVAAAGGRTLHVVVGAADLGVARSEILAGTILASNGRNPAGEPLSNAPDLPVENVVIVSETTLADGRVLIRLAADVRNQTSDNVSGITLNLSLPSGTINYEQANSALLFPGLLEANGVAPAPGALYFTVAAANLVTVRADVLDGDVLDVFGTELFVFNAPPRGIDQATEEAWLPPAQSGLGGGVTLVFAATNPFLDSLLAGDLLVEDPGINRLAPPAYDNPFDPNDDHPDKVLADYLPLQVVSVLPGTGGEILVTGNQVQLLEVVKSATFFQDAARSPFDNPVRDPYGPVLDNTYTDDEQDERDEAAAVIREADPRDGRLADLAGMSVKPWHFNELQISPKIKVTGEVLIRSSGLKIEVKIRNFQLERAIAHLDAGVIVNLVIECDGNEDTSTLSEEEKSAHIFDLVLPPVTFNIAGVPVQVAPLFYFDAGTEANFPQSLTLPLQSSFIVGMDMGFDRSLIGPGSDGFFYEPITEFIPLRVSEPSIFTAAAATVGVWAELGVGIVGSVAPLGVGQRGILNLGPSLSVRASADFTVAPFADPWWLLDFDVDVTGNFAMNILGESLLDLDIPIQSYELEQFDRDAGGPLIVLPGLNDHEPASDPIRPLSAKTVRWARSFVPSTSFGGFENGFVAPLSPFETEGAGWPLIVGGANGSKSTLARFTATGDLVWMKDFGINPLVRHGAISPDGRIITAGTKGLDLVVSQFDGDGNRQWVVSHRPALTLTVTELALGQDALGQMEIYLAGHVHLGSGLGSDPALIKLDAAGNVVWAAYYAWEGNDQVHGLGLTADGSILLGGFTEADVAPAELGTPNSDNVLKNATSSGLLMKIDPAAGSLMWATAYASRWGMTLEEVLEAPDGTLYGAGAIGSVVGVSRPVNLFAKFGPDGALLDHVAVGDDPDWVDELPNGGSSPYDLVTGLVWLDDGLWACGSTGLGDESAGWIMGLTDQLGAKFYSVFDGPRSEICLDLANAGDGIAVLATSRSIFPWGAGGQYAPLLLKEPWEGIMRFHEDTRINTLVLQPRVFHSSASTEFQMLSTVDIAGAPQTYANGYSRVALQQYPLAFTPGGSVAAPTDMSGPIVVAGEKVERGLIEDFDDWADYHHLAGDDADPGADSDGDGLKNVFEAFFGRSPYVAESDPPVTISTGELNGQPVVVIQFDRSTFSQSLGVTFESSETLDAWLNATGLIEVVQPLSATQERVNLVAAQDVPKKFYKFVASVANPTNTQ